MARTLLMNWLACARTQHPRVQVADRVGGGVPDGHAYLRRCRARATELRTRRARAAARRGISAAVLAQGVGAADARRVRRAAGRARCALPRRDLIVAHLHTPPYQSTFTVTATHPRPHILDPPLLPRFATHDPRQARASPPCPRPRSRTRCMPASATQATQLRSSKKLLTRSQEIEQCKLWVRNINAV